MIKKARALLAASFMLVSLSGFNAGAAASNETVQIKCTNIGITIYEPPVGKDYGYMYGPTILINPDKSIDVWASSVPRSETEGNGIYNGWDSIRYKHSSDNGKTWTDWAIVLEPTAGTVDALSTCDPGVFKMGEYYYIGYTSTINQKGTQNNVFVSRSKNPNGPFEKWTGSGWGTKPKAVTNYTGDPNSGGCSMPSFLVKDNTVYMYYTYQDENGGSQRLATAPADDPNWPAKLTVKGDCIITGGEGSPSDIKYSDSLGKFIGICAINMYEYQSYINVYESTDGINFKVSGMIKENTKPYLHNAGISSAPNGHIDVSMQNFIGYAYVPNGGDPKWGWWAMRFAPISITSVAPTTASTAGTTTKATTKATTQTTAASTTVTTETSVTEETTTVETTSSEATDVTELDTSGVTETQGGQPNVILIGCLAAIGVAVVGGGVGVYMFVIRKKVL
jgi:hypothetical protein